MICFEELGTNQYHAVSNAADPKEFTKLVQKYKAACAYQHITNNKAVVTVD